MDAGVAAVLGAIAGGVITGIPAIASAWWTKQTSSEQMASQQQQINRQRRIDHLRDRREPRRLAYREFISHLVKIQRELKDCVHLQLAEIDVEAQDNLAQADQTRKSLQSSFSTLVLEGPEQLVHEAAEALNSAFEAYDIIFWEEHRNRTRTPEESVPSWDLQFSSVTAVSEATDSFSQEAARILDDEGAPH